MLKNHTILPSCIFIDPNSIGNVLNHDDIKFY